jgi:rubrerythrin
MEKCELCGKSGEDLSLFLANHKKLGQLWVCHECWGRLYDKNLMVSGSTGSGGSCPTCR